MVDRAELERLLATVKLLHSVNVVRDDEGRIETIQVLDFPGVGKYPMSPISFAEKMRPLLTGRKS